MASMRISPRKRVHALIFRFPPSNVKGTVVKAPSVSASKEVKPSFLHVALQMYPTYPPVTLGYASW